MNISQIVTKNNGEGRKCGNRRLTHPFSAFYTDRDNVMKRKGKRRVRGSVKNFISEKGEVRIMRKKLCAIGLVIALAATMMTGCSENKKGEEATKAPSATEAAGQPSETPTPTEGAEVLLPEIADNSVEFAKNLKLGWNLGNTLDANAKPGLDAEISWGQPKTTKELIEAVHAAGFTSIRIPVSWGTHTDEELNIDEEWMARVHEVVDYAMDCGMFVILNMHHDNDYYYPSEERYEQSEHFLTTMWTQIAESFKDYDERLIFEDMNEPRLAGTPKEWWFSSNDPDGVASIQCIVRLNQKFVDIVRATGGKNATRYLMVPSHAASADTALNSAFTVPVDPANRIMVSVHAYSPYDFAMNKNGYKNWDTSKERDLGFMQQLKTKFIDKGIGVVIGEMGATNKDNLADRIAWADSYTRMAAERGISCFWWDNSGVKVGEENFGLISRNGLYVFYQGILDAMLNNYK